MANNSSTEVSGEENSRDVLMRIMTRLIQEQVALFRAGFNAFEPDEQSMDKIEHCASQLWDAYNEATLLKVNREFHYKKKEAKSDKRFQAFMNGLIPSNEA